MISESYKSKKKISEWSSAPILSLSLFIDYYFFHLSIKIRNEFTKKHQFNIFFKTFFFQFHNFVQFYYWWQNSLVVMRPDIISADGALTSERKMVNGRLVIKERSLKRIFCGNSLFPRTYWLMCIFGTMTIHSPQRDGRIAD